MEDFNDAENAVISHSQPSSSPLQVRADAAYAAACNMLNLQESQVSDDEAAEVAVSPNALKLADSEQAMSVPASARPEAVSEDGARQGSQDAKLDQAVGGRLVELLAVGSDVDQHSNASATSPISQPSDATSSPPSVSPFRLAQAPPLLSSVTTPSDPSSHGTAQSTSSMPASLLHTPSTTQRSYSAAQSQVSDSDATYTSNLISAASLGAQSEQPSNSQATSLDGDQADRVASNAKASTSASSSQRRHGRAPTLLPALGMFPIPDEYGAFTHV